MPDPNRLQLRRIPGSTMYFVWHHQKWIAQIDSVPFVTRAGITLPAIMLKRKCSEQLLTRIKNLVNKRDQTNRDIRVIPPPPSMNHPAIQRHLLRKQFRW